MDRIVKREAEETPELSNDTLFTTGKDFFSQLHTRLTASESQNRQNELKILEMERKLEKAQEIIASQNIQLQNFNEKFEKIEKTIEDIAKGTSNPYQSVRMQNGHVQRVHFVSKGAPRRNGTAKNVRSTDNSGYQRPNQQEVQFPLLRLQAKPQSTSAPSAAENNGNFEASQQMHQRIQQVFHFGVQPTENVQNFQKTRPRPY